MTELASLPVLGWGSATKVAPIEADDQARGPYFGAYGAEPPETREEAGRRMPARL